MRAKFHRILATLLTFAVLMLGVNCACLGAFGDRNSSASVASEMASMPCCAHHDRSHPCDASNHPTPSHHHPCSGVCEHCGQAVLNDVVASTGDFATQLNLTGTSMAAPF